MVRTRLDGLLFAAAGLTVAGIAWLCGALILLPRRPKPPRPRPNARARLAEVRPG